jgi:hypothetical protein
MKTFMQTSVTTVSMSVLVWGVLVLPAGAEDPFHDPNSWTAYDPGANGVGNDPDGFAGVASDGRYVYFVPLQSEYGNVYYSGEVMRYDRMGEFSDRNSWETFDTHTTPIPGAVHPYGYEGNGAFDGRYIYFAPYQYHAGSGNFHSEVLRYDTTGTFSQTSSWSTFAPNAKGGYTGAVAVGRYVYFSPYQGNGGPHGEVLRYDREGSFDNSSSWTTYDAGDHGVGTDPDGYNNTVYDGQRYLYFVPGNNGSSAHAEVLRYDTWGQFDNASFWTTYDATHHGVGHDGYGYNGGTFDGRYIYFAPEGSAGSDNTQGEVLRYDTQSPFDASSSWAAFDAGDHGVGNDPDGYHSAVFDGQYVYFVPHFQTSSVSHREVLRYNTAGAFDNTSSWDTCIPTCASHTGYWGAYFDGQYIYFSPSSDGSALNGPHGEVLRYEVPEPTAISLLVLGSSVLLRRRNA